MKTLINFKQFSFILLLAGTFVFTSCKKDNDPSSSAPTQAEEQSAVDNSTAEDNFDNASTDVEDAVMSDAGASLNVTAGTEKSLEKDVTKDYDCAKVTISALKDGDFIYGRQVVIDFGTAGCKIKKDGRTRKGKIIITFNRAPKDEETGNPLDKIGRKVTTTFDGYEVDGVKVEGTKVVERVASVDGATRSHSIKITGAKLTFTDASTTTWNSERVRSYFNNSTPLEFADDTFKVTGSASGKNRKGVEYTSTITSALVWKLACILNKVFIPVQGTIQVVASPRPTATIDFGTGDCDNIFTVTVAGQTKTIDATKK